MRLLLLSFLLLAAAPNAWAVPGPGTTVSTITVAGRVFTDLTNLKILSCSADGTTLVRCTLAISTAPTAGYAVTTAKNLRIRAVQWRDSDPTSYSTVTFYQSDNDTGQTGASTALTNGSQKSVPFGAFPPFAGSPVVQEFATNFTVAAGKYLSAQLSAVAKSVQVFAYGYEE